MEEETKTPDVAGEIWISPEEAKKETTIAVLIIIIMLGVVAYVFFNYLR